MSAAPEVLTAGARHGTGELIDIDFRHRIDELDGTS